MASFAVRYLKALAVLAAVMGLYCLSVVPLIEPPAHGEQARPSFERGLPTDHWWQAFFAEDAWQRQQPKIINTKQGILVSKTWERIDDRTWTLKPLTMIMPQSQSSAARRGGNGLPAKQQDMWIISAAEGATIHFEKPLDITTGNVPTVSRGDLSGQIEVTRKTAAQADERPWRLLTSDLSINRRQISTQREVLIQWGSSIVRGRALRILLRGDLLNSQSPEQSAWGPLDQLELFHVDEIDIELPPGGLWADMDIGRLAEEPQLRKLPARLTATSGGRFAFDFKASVATLQNGVQLVHQLGDLPPDTFACNFVSLVIEPPAKDASSRSQTLGGLQFKSFEASGVDSLRDFVGEKWVEIKAPTLAMSARSKNLKVDLNKRRVSFAGRLNRPGATQSTVILNYQGNEFLSPRIEYQAPPESIDGATADHLGWMFAEGPGEVRTAKTPGLGTSTVRWQEALKMAPAPDGVSGQWIELVGNTLVESPAHGFLASERIEIWLQRLLTTSGGIDRLGDAPSSPDAAQAEEKYLPTRVYASGKTVLGSTAIQAEVQELDLNLKYAQPTNDTPQAETGLELSDSAGNPMYQFVSPPEPTTSDQLAGAAAPPESPPATDQQQTPAAKPVSVTGHQLTATVVSSPAATWIERLSIRQDIKLWRELEPTDLPWHIEGTQLLLATNPAGEVDMQIEGQPAKVVIADGYLQGPSIRLNQTHNLVLMDHPGELIVPLEALKNAENARGTNVEWVDTPVRRWQGRMIFDGSQATIERDVEFKGALRTPQDQFWWISGVCDSLQVVLSEPMRFDSQVKQQVQLDRVILSDDVQLLASEIIGRGERRGEKKSRQQIRVPSLTFNVQQEEFVGQGPGWVKSWFLSAGQLGQLASATSVQPSEEPSRLRGAHLTFRDSMFGQLSKNALTFSGKVELLTGPLQDWEQSIDVNQARQLSLEQTLLGCDQLKVYDTTLPNAYRSSRPSETWEFQAIGNVAFNGKVESGEYVGTGHQLTYAKAKERLHLRGDGRNAAFLKRIPADPKQNVIKGFVESVDINPQTMDLHNLEVGQGGFQVESRDAYDNQGFVPAGQAPAGNNSVPQTFEPLPNTRPNFYKRD